MEPLEFELVDPLSVVEVVELVEDEDELEVELVDASSVVVDPEVVSFFT